MVECAKKLVLKAAALVIGLVGMSGSWSHAATIELNVDPSTLSSLDPVFTARYKYDTTGGVDQMLFKQPSPSGYPAADVIRMNGTLQGSATYEFTLTSDGANGYSLALTNGSVSGGASFAGAGSANNTLTKTFSGADALAGYNVLHIYAVADKDAEVSFSNLSFTSQSPGLTTSGALQNAFILTSPGTVVSYDQWLAAPTGTNLGDFAWTLSGLVTLTLDGQRPSTERIKFEVTGKEGIYTPAVPEPSSMIMAAVGLGASGLLIHRRRNRVVA